MEAMRESWTDARLDDFREDVGRRFDEVDKRFDKVDERFDRVDKRMEDGFARLNDRLDGLHHLLFRAAVALIVGLLGALVALVVVLAQHA
jgi:hypothetical protein